MDNHNSDVHFYILQTTRDFTLLYCLLCSQKKYIFSFSSSISLSRLCRCASLSLSMFLSLSLCPAVSLQWTNSPGERTSQSAHSAFTEVVSESVIPHLFCFLCATWSEEFHYLSMLVCVCVSICPTHYHTHLQMFSQMQTLRHQ